MHAQPALALIGEIDRIFPAVVKPADNDLVEHPVDCVQCSWVRNHLRPFDGPILPREALRGLHDDMSCLTAAGWRWAVPSFLRHCLSGPHIDDIETEFMIYFLGGVEASEPDIAARLASFDDAQISCLCHVLEWCTTHPHWSDYCADNVARALMFLRCLREK